MEKVTGYELSRSFFDWSYENVGKVKPVHVALYFFAIEHCNRLGWKAQFGMPTQMSMDAIGIKNWKTYSAAFNDLEEWGFFRVVERSKNQYSATVIALVKNTKALSKALSKASQKHYQKHCPEQVQSIVGIDKLNNLEPRTNKQALLEEIKLKMIDDYILSENVCRNRGFSKGQYDFAVSDFLGTLPEPELEKEYSELGRHFGNWCRQNERTILNKQVKPAKTAAKDDDWY